MRLIAMCLMLVSCFAFATEETFEFANEAERQLFKSLTFELRCPKCQNQNIADSNAMIAVDMRRKVHELIREGKSREEIVNFMKARYGEFVSYKPPVTPVTLWLWMLPVLFVFAAWGGIALKQRKERPVSMNERIAEADKLLESDK